MKSLLLFSLLVVAASAHLCLIGPHQRGTMDDLNTAGAKDCFLTDNPPCGGRDKQSPQTTTFMKGMNASITFQKNLDHFNAAKPGAFIVNLWYGTNFQSHMQLGSIEDSADAKSGYLYTLMVPISNDIPAGTAILQVNYMTNNPQAPANFYQCADVMIK